MGLPNWLDYGEAKTFANRIKQRLEKGDMPPPNARVNYLDTAEKNLVISWVDGGALMSESAPCESGVEQAPPANPNDGLNPGTPAPGPSNPLPEEPPLCTDPSQQLDIVSYAEDTRPQIFERVCLQCHGTIAGLPNWMSYSVAFSRKDAILTRIQNGTMPPPNANINTLTPTEIQLISDWITDGAQFSKLTCDAPPVPEPLPPPPDPEPPANPTYEEHLKPQIFTAICGACHGVLEKIPNWQIYEEAYGRSDKIKKLVEKGEMPPPDTGIQLTDNQKELIYRWVDQGAVRE
jgi:mono/diheme cytochrome c family protein